MHYFVLIDSFCAPAVAQHMQDVRKLRSLGIMLGMESCDWEYARTNSCSPADVALQMADWWIRTSSNASWKGLATIMMQPAIKEVRIAQNIRKFCPGLSDDSWTSSVGSLSAPLSSFIGYIPNQYQSSYIGLLLRTCTTDPKSYCCYFFKQH